MIDVNKLVKQRKVWLGGTGEMFRYSNGSDTYLFKPAYRKGTHIEEPFRAYAQEVGYEIQRLIDPQSAIECKVVVIDGIVGAIQREIDVDKERTKDILDFQIGERSLQEEYIKSLMREYITDYLLCNYDSHARNFIIGKDGILRGIDKEQAFEYIAEEDMLDAKFSYNFNSKYGEIPSIYSVIFQKIKAGELSPEILDYVDDFVEKIKKIPTEEYRKLCIKYAKSLNPENPDVVLDKIVKRKVELGEVISKLKKEFNVRDLTPEQKSLEKVLNEVMNISYIVSQTNLLSRDIDFDKSEKINTILAQAINYCIILGDNTGIEEFLKIKDRGKKFEFIKAKVAEKLSINPDDINSRKDEVYRFIFDSYYSKGYVFHTTNSVASEEIKKTGLTTNKRIWNYSEINEIQDIYTKYGCSDALGWLYGDLSTNAGWFFDNTPKNIPYYSGSPEWMAQFCGQASIYYGEVSQDERLAFQNRDYDTAKKNIKRIHKKKRFNEEDSKKVLDFFEKYWEIYKDATQCLVMIPKSEVSFIPSYDSRKDYYHDEKQFYEYLEERLKELIIDGDDSQNTSIRADIEPDNLLFVDISPLFVRKKIKVKEETKGIVTFGKHEPIPYEKQYGKYFRDMTGYEDSYQIVFEYKDYSDDEVKEIDTITRQMLASKKVFNLYLINQFGEATANSTGIVGGFYSKPEYLDEVIQAFSEVRDMKFVGIEEEKKKEEKYNQELEIEQLVRMIKGFDFEKREKAIKLIKLLEKDEINIESIGIDSKN